MHEIRPVRRKGTVKSEGRWLVVLSIWYIIQASASPCKARRRAHPDDFQDAGRSPLAFLRGGEEKKVSVRPALKGKVEGDDLDCRRWNMTVKEINKHKEPTLYFYRKQGVFIQGVRYPGNAADAQVSMRDVLLAIDGKAVLSLDDCRRAYEEIMADGKREKKVLLELERRGLRKWVVLDYVKDYDKGD